MRVIYQGHVRKNSSFGDLVMEKRMLGSMLGQRADRLLGVTAAAVAATTGAGVVGTTATVEADIIYSGPVNIAVPDSIDGIYLDVVTGATASAGFATYDINPYSSPNGNFNLWGPDAATWFNIAGQYIQPVGTIVDNTGAFGRPGGGNISAQVALNSDQNYLGFEFVNEALGGQTQYGWIQFQFGATAGTRSIVGYAYENTGGGIAIGDIGAIPEPATFGLLALGAIGLTTLRRRRHA